MKDREYVIHLLNNSLSVCSRCGVVIWKRLQNEHAAIHLEAERGVVFHMHNLGDLLLGK